MIPQKVRVGPKAEIALYCREADAVPCFTCRKLLCRSHVESKRSPDERSDIRDLCSIRRCSPLERSPNPSPAPCAKPVGIRTAAEQATAGINRPGPLSVGERRLRRDLVLRDDGFGPREILQQALAGQDKEVITELRILEVDLEQLFIADRQDAASFDTFDRRGPAVVR